MAAISVFLEVFRLMGKTHHKTMGRSPASCDAIRSTSPLEFVYGVRARCLCHVLEVNEVAGRYVQCVGHKVVLDGGVHLHDVAALPSHVHVVDIALHTLGPRSDGKSVRSAKQSI